METNLWRKCSSCKGPLNFGAKHFVCSVSSCNGQRTGYVFCSVPCFERHLPGARHKDAAAIEAIAPTSAATSAEDSNSPRRIIPKTAPAAAVSTPAQSAGSADVLIVASRLKDFIQQRSSMNTSAGVMDVLSQHVRLVCDRAMDNAREDGRKTVMERDFEFLKSLK